MKLTSGPMQLTKINGKTSAFFFQDLKVGDIIMVELVLKNLGDYKHNLKIRNLTTDKSVFRTVNQFMNIVETAGFEFTPL